MSQNETNDRDFVQRLTRLDPAAATADPRVTFYKMGFAAALSSNPVPEQSTDPAKRLTVGWLTAAAAIAACIMAAFLTGYAIKPNPAPERTNAVAENSRLSLRESSVERDSAEAKDDTKNQQEPESPATPIDPAYPRSRAEMLTAVLQDRGAERELNAYGVSHLQHPVPRGTERSSGNQQTFVSTLTRMDYLNWENSQ